VEADQGTVIEQAFAEAVRRDPDPKRRWVVLTDGQEDLLRQVYAAAKRYKMEIVLVQDLDNKRWDTGQQKMGHPLFSGSQTYPCPLTVLP